MIRFPLIRLFALIALPACTRSEKNQTPFIVGGIRIDPDSLNAYLATHRGFTSRGGEMRCAYRPLGQRGTRLFVWAVCGELLAVDGHLVDGSGMSLPAAFDIEIRGSRARVVGVEIPTDGNDYGASIRRIFPPSTWPAIFSNRTRDHPAAGLYHQLRIEAAARFGLPRAAADAPGRRDPEPNFTIDSGSFALVVRGDTSLIDEFVRKNNSLEGVVRTRRRNAKFGWARYRVEFSPSGEATRSQLSFGRVGTSPDSVPESSYTTTFGPDSIVEEWPNRGPTHLSFVRGTVPLFEPSIAMLQEVVRRGARIAPPLRELGVPVYPLMANGTIERLRVHWVGRDDARDRPAQPRPIQRAASDTVASDTVVIAWGNSGTARYAVNGWKIVRGRNGDFITVRRRATVSPARLDSAARRIVEFLRGKGSFEQIELADSVTLYVDPEGGGGRARFGKEQLRNPFEWRVRSGGRVISLAPPAAMTRLTTKVGRQMNCREQSLERKFPRLAQFPHVGTMLEPERARSCLQTWNLTFVFDTSEGPRLIAAIYDQWEW